MIIDDIFSSVGSLRKALRDKREDFWHREGEAIALNLFHDVSKRVPAYKDFLRKNKIDPAKIKTISDFSGVPTVNKSNYLRAYPWEKLCRDGNPGSMDMISVSSGSTGEPFYWLRGKAQERESAFTQEIYLTDSFEVDKYSTLFIVSFAMGLWVGGTVIHRGTQASASKFDMSVITPGINIPEVLRTIKMLGKKYDQIIIAGYPPFVKDIIDEGVHSGMNWKDYRIKFLFAAEAFSEMWRDYMYKKVGAEDVFKDSLNIYGTAEAAIMGHETPLSIFIKRAAGKNRTGLYKEIFKFNERVPTLIQYNPMLRYYEDIGGRLIFSANSGIPLVRYDIGDTGGIVEYSKMAEVLKGHSINLDKEIKTNKISNWKLPFLFVYGRADFTASLYGANIYPENIKDVLGDKALVDYVSGKFVMLTKNDKDLNPYLELNVELKNSEDNYPAGLRDRIVKIVTTTLASKNNEYKELHRLVGKKAEPDVKLYRYGDEKFFKQGIKQKWHKT